MRACEWVHARRARGATETWGQNSGCVCAHRGTHRDFWEFAIKSFKSADEVKQIKDLLAASSGSADVATGRNDSRDKAAQQEAAQATKLRAALPRITETNATLKKMRDVSMVRPGPRRQRAGVRHACARTHMCMAA